MSLVETNTAPAPKPAKTERKRVVSAKLRQAIELIESGECKTQKAACQRVGITEQYLSRSFGQVHVQAFIAQKRARNIATGSLRASRRLVDLIDAESEHVAAKVSQAILVTTGDLKGESGGGSNVSVNVGVNVQAGYVINLAGGRDAGLINNQKASDAKPLNSLSAVPHSQSERGET